jgi:hypothetical protein
MASTVQADSLESFRTELERIEEIVAAAPPFYLTHQMKIERVESFIADASLNPNFGIDFSGKLELGSQLREYRTYGDQLELIYDIKSFPVLADGQIVAVFSLIYFNDVYVGSNFCAGISAPLRAFLAENDHEFALIYGYHGVYVITEYTKELLRGPIVFRSPNSIVPANAYIDLSEVRFASLVGEYTLHPFDEEYHLQSRMNLLLRIHLDAPFIHQGHGTMLCWAASASSVGNFMTGMHVLPHTIALRTGIGVMDGANAIQTRDTLITIFGVSSNAFDSLLFHETLIQTLAIRRPIIAFFFPPDWSMGHAVVFHGWNSRDYFIPRISVMDPAVGFRHIEANLDTIYFLIVNGRSMSLRAHIR